MTNDEIIEMVKQAGIRFRKDVFYSGHCDGVHGDELIAFAKLVAQHEREACAKIAETPKGEYAVIVACGTESTPHQISSYLNWQDIAKTIRARGQA
jgi:hypothetical protein